MLIKTLVNLADLLYN